jgi:hypothetical protein
MVRCSQYASLHSFGENIARQIFSFHFARPALIDAILLTGIAFRQIR